jgi:thiamine phosphate synthase YjbQ (UPF0047 family)
MSGVIFGCNVRLRGTVFLAVMLLVLLIMTVFPVSIAGKMSKPTSSSSTSSSPHTPAPATGRRPNSAAIPRKKHAAAASSKSVSSLWKSLGNNDAVKKWTRKLKGSSFFSSDIERWVLTLTDPSEDAIHLPTMQLLSQAITDSNRNIDLAMIVLGKLSRKLCEDSAFTKFKALLVLHHLISPGLLSAGDCAHMRASIVALRKERDARNDMKKFFARQSVDSDSMAPPATVSELALSNIIADYYDYLFSFVERSYQRKSSRDKVIANRAGQLENKSWSEMHNMNRELTQILSKIVEDGLGRQLMHLLNTDVKFISKRTSEDNEQKHVSNSADAVSRSLPISKDNSSRKQSTPRSSTDVRAAPAGAGKTTKGNDASSKTT